MTGRKLTVAIRRLHSLRIAPTGVNECNGDISTVTPEFGITLLLGASKMWRKLLTALTLVLVSVAASAQPAPTDAQIRAAIGRLGVGTDEKGFAEFEVLYKSPRRSAEILIASLKPVRRGQYIGGKHPQVVWNLRALRSLTGLDFRAATEADLTEDEAHFLRHDPKTDEVHFFGTWMSRDRVWVAPLGAQRAIIGKWREWLEKNGKTFTYVNDRNFDNWYF